MAVDRGGLRYTIEVRDQFSRQLSKFRSEIAAIKRELGGLSAAQGRLNAARRRTSTAQRSADQAQLQRIRAIQAGVRQQQQVEQLRARVLRQQQREASASARQEIELFRRRKQEEARAARERAAALRRQEAAQKRNNRAVRQGSREFRRLRRSALSSEGAVNRVAFSFRRLIGIFAVFQAARAGAAGFSGLIRDSIQYTRTIEDSQISLAALFSTVGKVRNVQGELVEGARGFSLAQAEARRQTLLVQAAAVSTTATFQELLRAFQAGVGPGLEAGLNLDQIREITVRVSQAAAALTIPQNQLIEEIRSLLRGTIQARTTIVASVLGITNEDIRNAKEAGNLFEFLQSRLEGFRFAASATQQSFTGLLARVRDSLQIAGGAASVALFDELKVSFQELAGAFIELERDAEGKITGILPQEDAVRAAEGLFSRLADALRIFREGLQQLSVGQFGTILAAIGEVARVLGAAAAGFIQGFVASIDIVVRGVAALASAFGGGGGLIENVEAFGVLLGGIAGPLLVLVTLTGALRVGWFLLAPLVQVFRGALVASLTVARGLLAVVARLPGALFPALGAVIALVVGGEALAEAFLGAKGSIIDIGELIGLAFEQTITNAIGLADVFVTRVSASVRAAWQTLAVEAGIAFRNIRNALDLNLGGSEDLAALKNAEVALQNQRDRVGLTQRLAQLEAEVTEKKREQEQLEKDARDRAAQRFADLRQEVELRDEDPLIARINEAVAGLQDLTGLNFDELGEKFADGLIDTEDITGKLNESIQAFIEGRNGPSEADFQESPLSKYFNGVVENFQNGLALLRPIVQQLASFIADTIVDALDPTTDTDLRERFARFLQDIAKLIIQTLVQVAIARAVLGLVGGPAAGTATGLGFAEGGEIPDGHKAPRMARPKGVDPRDTTPIWAQPGEFMMKLDAVRRYGRDAMEAINKGLVAPEALQALIGKRSRRHIAGISSRGPRGYAEGGIIQQATDGAVTSVGASSGSSGAAAPTPAVIVANDQTMDKLLTGGGQAFRRYLEDNAQEIDGILRQGRSGG